MKHLPLCAVLVVALAGCSYGIDDESRNVQEHSRQTFPAAQLRTLRVENVSGSIEVTGSNSANATIEATKFAGHQDSVNNTQIVIDHSPDEIDAHTSYPKSGWFGGRGAGVDYMVSVPPGVSLHLANVSGPVKIRNTTGNVEIQEVSGPISAALGRVARDRDIRINTVSGGTTLTIARNSDVTVDVKSVSGGVRGFFPLNSDKGFVGQAVRARLGSGMATIDINAVSGSIDINPE
jgi:DUF4097 and DUF4098 domain-containing protein YvlB